MPAPVKQQQRRGWECAEYVRRRGRVYLVTWDFFTGRVRRLIRIDPETRMAGAAHCSDVPDHWFGTVDTDRR
jgi:hypothetical protein